MSAEDFNRPTLDRRVSAELDFHIEMRVRELVARGVPEADARREAVERFGDLERLRSELGKLERGTDRSIRRTRFLSELVQDARFALRTLRRRRTFAFLAILTLGLGIGAATAIYSIVDGVLLQPLPFSDPARIGAVWITQPSLANDPTISWLAAATPLGAEEYGVLRSKSRTLREVGLWTAPGVIINDESGREQLSAVAVTSSVLPLLGVRPIAGRAFAATEDVLGGPDVAMVSWETWQARFAGDTGLVGRNVTLDERPYRIIGILPPGVRLDRTEDAPAFWLPALRDSSDLPQRHNRSYSAIARLTPGATFAQATQEATTLLRAQANTVLSPSASDTTAGARVEEWRVDQGRDIRKSLFLLLGASGLLLLIACVNVAILQLSEANGRMRELAARAALGASAGRLARQLLSESLVLAFVSTVAGVAFAWIMLKALIALAPARLPGLDTVHLDLDALLFAILCATCTGLLFGIAPALLAGRTRGSMLVRVGAGQTTHGTRAVQRSLVALQIALSTVLLVEAMLLGRSLRALGNVDAGFRPTALTALRFTLPYPYDSLRRVALIHNVVRDLDGVRGVVEVTAADRAPFAGGAGSSPVRVERPGAPEPQHTQQRYVLPGFFETLGMHLVAGRFFDTNDRAGSEPVAIVSEAEVQRDFGGVAPLGVRVQHQRRWRRVVGVVRDVKYRGLSRENEPTIYIPYEQYPYGTPVFVVRGGDKATLDAEFKRLLRTFEPRATPLESFALPTRIERSFATERYRTVLVSVFGVMAVLLAAVGLYGVSMQAATKRRREMGIRLALGSTRAAVVRLLVSDAMRAVLIGLVVGIPTSLAAARVVQPYLFGVEPRDPVSLVSVGFLLIAVTAAASFVPAHVAGRSDPAAVMRQE